MSIPTIILIALVLITAAIIRTDWFARFILGGMYDWMVVEIVEPGKLEKRSE